MTLSNDCCLDFDSVSEMCVISTPFLIILQVDHGKQEENLSFILIMLAFKKNKKNQYCLIAFQTHNFELNRYKQHRKKMTLKRLLMRPILTHLDSPLYWLGCGFFAISERVFIVWLDVSWLSDYTVSLRERGIEPLLFFWCNQPVPNETYWALRKRQICMFMDAENQVPLDTLHYEVLCIRWYNCDSV